MGRAGAGSHHSVSPCSLSTWLGWASSEQGSLRVIRHGTGLLPTWLFQKEEAGAASGMSAWAWKLAQHHFHHSPWQSSHSSQIRGEGTQTHLLGRAAIFNPLHASPPSSEEGLVALSKKASVRQMDKAAFLIFDTLSSPRPQRAVGAQGLQSSDQSWQ